MTPLRSLPWTALLFAPLASMPVVVLCGLGTSDAGATSDFFSGVVFSIIFLPLSYIGLPAYLLLRRLHLVRFWTIGAIGVAIPLALTYKAPSLVLLTAVTSGFSVAMAAYFLARPPSQPSTFNRGQVS